jgi:hypothetical protein
MGRGAPGVDDVRRRGTVRCRDEARRRPAPGDYHERRPDEPATAGIRSPGRAVDSKLEIDNRANFLALLRTFVFTT